jgi:hypothetical protein
VLEFDVIGSSELANAVLPEICDKSKSRWECLAFLGQTYKFYLALENSDCDDYVTEKIFMNSYAIGLIPVVRWINGFCKLSLTLLLDLEWTKQSPKTPATSLVHRHCRLSFHQVVCRTHCQGLLDCCCCQYCCFVFCCCYYCSILFSSWSDFLWDRTLFIAFKLIIIVSDSSR